MRLKQTYQKILVSSGSGIGDIIERGFDSNLVNLEGLSQPRLCLQSLTAETVLATVGQVLSENL